MSKSNTKNESNMNTKNKSTKTETGVVGTTPTLRKWLRDVHVEFATKGCRNGRLAIDIYMLRSELCSRACRKGWKTRRKNAQRVETLKAQLTKLV